MSPFPDPGAGVPATGEPPAAGEPPFGRTVGKYRIVDELGRGGMAVVYRARDEELEREVAIKVLHGFFAGQGEIERRFQREAQAIAAIKHDSIVQIFDYAAPAGAMPAYIVAELVRGPTLKRLMDSCQGRLIPELAALIVARIADALAAAHARGIVHRDVKPDNIMLEAPAGGSVRVLLADFGVAHMTGAETMTATGALVGSPAYMSPEQARGEDVTAQSDIFSLGVTLYHACTGHLPFPGKDPLTVVVNILRGEMKRPSVISPRIGADLERIILRCLKPVPAERFADAGALRDELRALARDARLGDETALLTRLLSDAAALERELAPHLAEVAFERVRELGRRSQLTRALNEINRVFAYAPNHAGARAMMDRLSSRRRFGRVAVIAAGVAALGGVTAGTVTWLSRRGVPRAPQPQPAATHPDTTVAVASPPPSGPRPTVVGTETGAAAGPPRADAPAVAETATARSKAKKSVRDRPTLPAKEGSPAPALAPALPSAPQSAPHAASPPPPAPPLALGPATVPATATLEVRAWRGFCSPSVDDRPATMNPVYPDLSSGPHRIYCTLPHGERALVGTYDLRGGTRPNLVIRPDAGGKPTLVRPQ